MMANQPDVDRLIATVDDLASILETLLAHYGHEMPEADVKSRDEAISAARQLVVEIVFGFASDATSSDEVKRLLEEILSGRRSSPDESTFRSECITKIAALCEELLGDGHAFVKMVRAGVIIPKLIAAAVHLEVNVLTQDDDEPSSELQTAVMSLFCNHAQAASKRRAARRGVPLPDDFEAPTDDDSTTDAPTEPAGKCCDNSCDCGAESNGIEVELEPDDDLSTVGRILWHTQATGAIHDVAYRFAEPDKGRIKRNRGVNVSRLFLAEVASMIAGGVDHDVNEQALYDDLSTLIDCHLFDASDTTAAASA